jgi:DNA-binding CsgD family transcriptional regulator
VAARGPLGLELRSRALLSDGCAAELLYREAIGLLEGTHLPVALGRAHLVYGEWLRRAGRRVDAREQLRTALALLIEQRMDAFADRARRELLATGETVRKRNAATRDDLTAQESEVARLAGDGHTNPEIGARLFISPRTVEWHLSKVYVKLGIGSRRELGELLLGPARTFPA